ncbi:MAG: hypothetical protein Q4B21_00395 [Bacteroidia bacterium]|nr:hypothetical protein [Bacteroidia bacterium]
MIRKFCYLILTFAAILLFNNQINAAKWSSTVAVVVDKATYQKISSHVDAYAKAISTADRKGIVVADSWDNPQELRDHLKKMYDKEFLEGAVFIGNIPIPMIRDAQHMATAFKMDQKRNWLDSSVPSDRFYDDFDLKFNFIKRDTVNTRAFYYSLRADSPQEIQCDIYSARIKPPVTGFESECAAIAAFLDKAVAAHKSAQPMDKVLHFAGHGYNSDAMNARLDEAIALSEHFPFINNRTGALDFFNFTYDTYSKYRVKEALANENLDLAVMHHHGAEDTQYLNGAMNAKNPADWLWLAKNYFRTKYRAALERGEERAKKTMDSFIKQYNVPVEWFQEANNPELIAQDSVYAVDKDLVLADLDNYKSGARFIVLDACYNGGFIVDDYIAARYIFNPGNTMVVKANSVNTLQDTWTTELIGLLNLGITAGDWAKGQMTLESHLYGDPTFVFAPQSELLANVKGASQIARDIVKHRDNAPYWRALLDDALKTGNYPADITSLAIKMLVRNNAITSAELLSIAKENPSRIVRLEAFVSNKAICDSNLEAAIDLAIGDTYELTRRLGFITLGHNGTPDLIEKMATRYMDPNCTDREEFQISMSIGSFDRERFVKQMEKCYSVNGYYPQKERFDYLVKRAKSSGHYTQEDFNKIINGTASAKEAKGAIRYQRNACYPHALEAIYHSIENNPDNAFRIFAAEVLGWYKYSYLRESIKAKVEELYKKEKDEAVKNELLKSLNRLK